MAVVAFMANHDVLLAKFVSLKYHRMLHVCLFVFDDVYMLQDYSTSYHSIWRVREYGVHLAAAAADS